MPLLPYILDALTIFVSVLLADLVLDRIHRAQRQRRMRHLNALSQRARAVARQERASASGSERAKDRASAGGSGDSGATAT